jgi:hypothetical protein
MRVYVGFDDTDTASSERGTGKLARWFERELPDGCRLWGVVRQQLLVDDAIPYTSHNSSACAVLECAEEVSLSSIILKAAEHIERYFISGSDPGLCVVSESDTALPDIVSFGRLCTYRVVTQRDALAAMGHAHLSGHGGTDDGIIGAVAAVGLTADGWSGRFIELQGLRRFPETLSVADIRNTGIHVFSMDREAKLVLPDDTVYTNGWLRPRLWGGEPLLPVKPRGMNEWETWGRKRSNGNKLKGGT